MLCESASRQGLLLPFVTPVRVGLRLVVTRTCYSRASRSVMIMSPGQFAPTAGHLHSRPHGRFFFEHMAPAFPTKDAAGPILVTVLGMVAEMERKFIRERQQAGIEAAKAKGV